MATTEGTAVGFAEVSTLLWREREALQLLLFKIVEEQLIVRSGQTRWLAQANEEIELALAQLHGADLLRATEVAAVAEHLGLPGLPSLAELAGSAPEPWATVFSEHRESLLKLIDEVHRTTEDNRALLLAGERAVRETLLSITRTVETYASWGSLAAPAPNSILMDEQT